MKFTSSISVLGALLCWTMLPSTASFSVSRITIRTTPSLCTMSAAADDDSEAPISPPKKAPYYKKKKKKGFKINENLVGKVVSSEGIFEGRETAERPKSTLGVTREQLYSKNKQAMPSIVSVLVDNDYDPEGMFYKEALEATRVAFDCEGVDLSRVGTVELVSIAFSSGNVYLIDMQGDVNDELRKPRIAALKALLGSETILKVIHDCRMDADALYHLHGIAVRNIHDTSAFHEKVRDSAPLNELLVHYCLEGNEVRDSGVYRENPRFWATRPLTEQMMQWASGDVLQLLTVADRQVESCRTEQNVALYMERSKSLTENVVNSKVESVECFVPMGHIIGPRGANIRALESRTKTTIFGDSLKSNHFIVWYKSDDDLNLVKEAMGHE